MNYLQKIVIIGFLVLYGSPAIASEAIEPTSLLSNEKVGLIALISIAVIVGIKAHAHSVRKKQSS